MANSRIQQLLMNTNTVLTKLITGYSNNDFVGEVLFPTVQVSTFLNRIPSFAKDHLRIYETQRALRADLRIMKPGDFGYNDVVLEEDAIGFPIDWQENMGANAYVDLMQYGAKVVADSLLLKREYQIANMVQTLNNYGSGSKVTLSGTSKWTDQTNSDPVANILTGLEAIRGLIGKVGNTIVFGWTSWQDFRIHPKVVKAIFGPNGAGVVTLDQVAKLFEVSQCVVGAGFYMDSLSADTITNIWNDNVIIAYVPQSKSAQRNFYDPAFGYNLQHTATPPLVKDYDKDGSGKVHLIEGTMLSKITMLMPNAGYIINDTH